jgi:hypothetical protein
VIARAAIICPIEIEGGTVMDARRMFKAVIFDIDGTLLDSVDLHARS